MVDHDPLNDPQPQMKFKTSRNTPTVAALKTALQTANPTYWTDARIRQSTKDDLIYAARVASISVVGL